MKRLLIITDCTDVATNELIAVITRELDRLEVDNVNIEPPVFVKEFSIINGSFLTRLMLEIYKPENLIILIILNPLKTNRKSRARIIGKLKNGVKFISANTGVMSWAFRDFGIKRIYESEKKNLKGKEFISFGGKYIHAPIAAKISAGYPLEKIAANKFPMERIKYLNIKNGTVVHIDNFGVIKFVGKVDALRKKRHVKIYKKGKLIAQAQYTKSMKDLKKGTLCVYKGSSLTNILEIGIVRELNTYKKLGIKIGDILELA